MPNKYCQKNIPFRFSGSEIKLELSLELFSSNSIDIGTVLLLKTIASEIDLDRALTILDTGCGTGVIGLALKKKNPNCRLFMRDRDALAVYTAEMNGRLNRLESYCSVGLLLSPLWRKNDENIDFNLITANLPAKAGAPVLENFLKRAGDLLAPDGRVVVVIVNTLAGDAERWLMEGGCEILYKTVSTGHTVFHFTGGKKEEDSPEEVESINLHIREKRIGFYLHKIGYKLDTVYNIPDFDTPGFLLQLFSDLLIKRSCKGRALYFNPGQGHLPVFMKKSGNYRFDEIVLAGRDYLSINISRYNLLVEGYKGDVRTLPVRGFNLLTEELDLFDFVAVDLPAIHYKEWESDFSDAMGRIVKKEGLLILGGKSSDLFRALKNLKGFSTIKEKKSKGRKVILLKRS